MQVTETLNEGLKRGYTITVTAAELDAKVQEKLLEAQPEVEIKGFRKGKVPLAILKKQFGTRILGDALVLDDAHLREVVMQVPEVRECHRVRTRGSQDFVFLDLHIWLDRDLPLHEAHRISHLVKDRLMAHFPQVKDAVIHVEPDRQPDATLAPPGSPDHPGGDAAPSQ